MLFPVFTQTSVQLQVLNLILLFQLLIILLIQLVKSIDVYLILLSCNNYIDLRKYLVGTDVILDFYCANYTLVQWPSTKINAFIAVPTII